MKKKNNLKEKYKKVFEEEAVLLENISIMSKKFADNMDTTFEFMQNADQDLQGFLETLEEDLENFRLILTSFMAINVGTQIYFEKKQKK